MQMLEKYNSGGQIFLMVNGYMMLFKINEVKEMEEVSIK